MKKSEGLTPVPLTSWRYPAVTGPRVTVQVQEEALITFFTHLLPIPPGGFPSLPRPSMKGDPLFEPGDGAKETLPTVKKG